MAGRARTDYEKQILKAIRDLPECDLERIIQWVHCLRDELPDGKTPNGEDHRLFWDSFGSWEDEHSAKESKQNTISDCGLRKGKREITKGLTLRR